MVGGSAGTGPATAPDADSDTGVNTLVLDGDKLTKEENVDFVVGDEGAPAKITLLEVNTLPGMTATSLYPEAAGIHGLPMPQWCDALVVRAHARGATKRHQALPLPL